MTWLTWRQYRLQFVVGTAILALLCLLLVLTGLQLISQYHSIIAQCASGGNGRDGANCSNGGGLFAGGPAAGFVSLIMLATPVLAGLFLGAPMAAGEFETGTTQFAWTQAITRARWLTVKAGWLLLAALTWGGAVGALVTWWSGPQNAVAASQFNPGSFDVQGIMPAAYSLFAMALGIAAGTLIRRVLPALGVTLGVFFAVRLMIMGWVRQHYMTPITSVYNVSQSIIVPPKGAAWILGQGVRGPNGPLVMPPGPVQIVGNGLPVADIPAACHAYVTQGGSQISSKLFPCLTSHGYSQYITYQPAGRYWPFQFIEAGIFVVLAAALIGLTFAVINRRDA
jgi:hypothetical protein